MSTPGVPNSLRAERERIVRAHIDAEERGAWDEALATFHRPRYEIIASGESYENAESVAGFYAETARAFPSISFETRALHHTGAGVFADVVFHGMHDGPWRGLPGTGRQVEYAMLNFFMFEDERLVCERMYFDLLTVLRQVGIARDPTSLSGRVATLMNHPLTFARALTRSRRSQS
jgi:steroid delta-isomerase-like uncharacterized protein